MAIKTANAVVPPTRTKKATVTYPYHPLANCLDIAKGVREIGNGKQPVSRSLLASHLKLDENSGDFAQKLASSKCYGLIDGRSDYSLTELSRGYFFPTVDVEIQKRLALLAAARSPGAFAFLLDRYDGSKPPNQELIGNVLSSELGIPDSWRVRIASFFLKTMEIAGALSQEGFLRHKAEVQRLSSDHVPRQVDHEDDRLEQQMRQPAKTEDVSPKEKSRQSLEEDHDQEGIVVWKYPFGGKLLRIETPENISKQLCEKLKRYIDVLAPDE